MRWPRGTVTGIFIEAEAAVLAARQAAVATGGGTADAGVWFDFGTVDSIYYPG